MAEHYDIVVIGGGHAGAEAAWAAARMGCRTALVTMQLDAIGRMSCNPAIGGLGKGQIVREIDAMGGLMALATDATAIQFRMLNRGKGPAVWAPRAQADRALYSARVSRLLENTPGLDLVEGVVEEVLTKGSGVGGQGSGKDGILACDSALRATTDECASGSPRRISPAADSDRLSSLISHPSSPCVFVSGVRLQDGREFRASAVVLTSGTFMRGLLHCGHEQTPGGRIGEPAATGISESLLRLGLRLARLKTGTPARLHRDSIDYDRLERQNGDDPPIPFSFMNDAITQPQIPCWITFTNTTTHEIIRANLHRAPMYSGQIQSRGPRYCPSIEDKVVRFADKDRHQIFLEPEGYDDERIYCNGIPTSLPKDVQEPLVHSIVGLEKAVILQYGYAVEYDWVPTDQIHSTLETKTVSGLFLAGQINGTSGYEEAAAQGLMAGINAVAKLRGTEPLVLGRDEAYIGVMIDDIVTRPPDEPYRMFTSRAEYRLLLRSDNADMRLTPTGRRIGLVDDARWAKYEQKRNEIASLETWLANTRTGGESLREQLRRTEVRIADLIAAQGGLPPGISATAVEQVEINAKYDGYIVRQNRQIERFRQIETVQIPDWIEYAKVSALRIEAREKFTAIRPRTLGQAGRISGISPADISVLYLFLRGK